MVDQCSIEGCTSQVGGRGMCSTHYQHWRRANLVRPCRVNGCDTPTHARGLCSKHYQRLQDFGTTDDPVVLTPEQRFYQFVDIHGPFCHYDISIGNCWLWTGSLTRGYGQFMPSGTGSRPEQAHVFMYRMVMGKLPPKPLELDHLCSNPRCVRFSHLEPVTHAQNMQRAYARGTR